MSAAIHLTAIDPQTFLVQLPDAGASEAYRVTVPPSFVASLGLPQVDNATLVEASFAFLLEREPAHSILKTFDLPTISAYFPDYVDELRRRLGRQNGEPGGLCATGGPG